MANFYVLLCLLGFLIDDTSAGNKRILVSGQDLTQVKLQNIETTLQDLQSQLSVTKSQLAAHESKFATQEQTIMTQGQMIIAQQQTITNHEHTISTLEKKLFEEEANITSQQTHVLQQENKITIVANNLSEVMSHNFIDEMAQAMCASDTDHTAYVYALRRDCSSGHAPSCSSICSDAASQMVQNTHTHVDCFDAFHVQKTHGHLDANPGGTQPNAGKPFMFVYRYLTSGCSFKDVCGPNYCCCRATS